MTVSNQNPVADSLLNAGDSFSFELDDGGTTPSDIQVTITGAATEVAYTLSGGAQPGYGVSVSKTGDVYTFTVSKTAGWDASPFGVLVEWTISGVPSSESWNYELAVEQKYPNLMQPRNPVSQGSLILTENDVARLSDCGWIDFVGATVTNLGNGKARVTITGGGGAADGFYPLTRFLYDASATDAAGLANADFRLNNADVTAATKLYADDTDYDGSFLSSVWPLLNDGRSYLFIRAEDNSRKVVYRIDGVTDQVGYTEFDITYVTSVGGASLVDNDTYGFSTLDLDTPNIVSTGSPGPSTGNGYPEGTIYTNTVSDEPWILVDATTDANVWRLVPESSQNGAGVGFWQYAGDAVTSPASGKFSFDTSGYAAATNLYVHQASNSKPTMDHGELFSKLRAGDFVFIGSLDDSTVGSYHRINGTPTETASVWDIPLDATLGEASTTAFNLNENCYVIALPSLVIADLPEKASPVGTDTLVVEDSADGNKRKRVQLTNLPVVAGATEQVEATVRNASGSPMSRGDAVYISGWNAGAGLPEVSLAQSNAAATMPAYGIVADTTIANNANGTIVVLGALTNTAAGGWSVGDALYVSDTVAGGLTNTRPTSTDLVQRVATVTRVSGQTDIQVVGAGRSNDLTNFGQYTTKDEPDTTDLIALQEVGGTYRSQSFDTLRKIGKSNLGRYAFDTSTVGSDPGSGNVRFNSATLSIVSAIYINDVGDEGGTGIGSILANDLKIGDLIVFRSKVNSDYFICKVTSNTDNTGWHAIGVSSESFSGGFANGEDLDVFLISSGSSARTFHLNLGGRILATAAGTWYTQKYYTPWTDANWNTAGGTGADPSPANFAYACTYLAPYDMTLQELEIQFQINNAATEGYFRLYKVAVADGTTGTGTWTQLGSNMSVNGADATNDVNILNQSGLSDAVSQGDKLVVAYITTNLETNVALQFSFTATFKETV